MPAAAAAVEPVVEHEMASTGNCVQLLTLCPIANRYLLYIRSTS